MTELKTEILDFVGSQSSLPYKIFLHLSKESVLQDSCDLTQKVAPWTNKTKKALGSSPGWLWKAFWSDVSVSSTDFAQVRRKRVGEVSMYQAYPPRRSGRCCFPMQVCSGSSNQTPSAAVCIEWLYPCASLSRQNSLYLCRDVTRSRKTYRSAPRLQFHLLFAVCALFTLTNRRQKKTKKERERTQLRRSALWDRQDKLKKGNIHCHQPAPGRGEERGSSVLRHVNYLPTDFLRNS